MKISKSKKLVKEKYKQNQQRSISSTDLRKKDNEHFTSQLLIQQQKQQASEDEQLLLSQQIQIYQSPLIHSSNLNRQQNINWQLTPSDISPFYANISQRSSIQIGKSNIIKLQNQKRQNQEQLINNLANQNQILKNQIIQLKLQLQIKLQLQLRLQTQKKNEKQKQPKKINEQTSELLVKCQQYKKKVNQLQKLFLIQSQKYSRLQIQYQVKIKQLQQKRMIQTQNLRQFQNKQIQILRQNKKKQILMLRQHKDKQIQSLKFFIQSRQNKQIKIANSKSQHNFQPYSSYSFQNNQDDVSLKYIQNQNSKIYIFQLQKLLLTYEEMYLKRLKAFDYLHDQYVKVLNQALIKQNQNQIIYQQLEQFKVNFKGLIIEKQHIQFENKRLKISIEQSEKRLTTLGKKLIKLAQINMQLNKQTFQSHEQIQQIQQI